MYYITYQYNRWQVYEDKEDKPILCGLGSVETAIAIARLNDIFLTFENCEIKERAA